MSVRFFACRDVVDLTTDYLEGALGPDETERVELHLTMCAACVEYVQQMRWTVAVTSALAESEVDPEAVGPVLDVFRRWRR